MQKTLSEASEFCQEFLPLVLDVKRVEMAICPPFTSLDRVSQLLTNTNVFLGGQNLFYEEKGAFTGEISSVMLKDIGCKYVIIGHSERRHILKETDEFINLKLKAALNVGIMPILCVGETLVERENNQAKEVVKRQLVNNLKGIDIKPAQIVVAYEPVWAIGTGINASPEDAGEMSLFIREQLGDIYNSPVAETTRILYGGSVKADNIGEFLSQNDVDGALVGGASLDATSFANLIRVGENV